MIIDNHSRWLVNRLTKIEIYCEAKNIEYHNQLEPRFYCESGVERRILEIVVGDYN